MILHAPFTIGPRLMPALQVGGAFISLGTGQRNGEGRTQYGCFIDLPDKTEHEVTDLRSGCQGGGTAEGFASLLSFLTAAAESYGFRIRTGRKGENEELFPPAVVRWAYDNADELSSLQFEIEESETVLIEEGQ